MTKLICYDMIIEQCLKLINFNKANANMKLARHVLVATAAIIFFSTPALNDTTSLGGNPIIGFKYNTPGQSGLGSAANIIFERTLLTEIFNKSPSPPFIKNFYDEYKSFATSFSYKGYLLEFIDFDSSDNTKIIATSFFDDPIFHGRSTSKDTIQNTTSALSLARVKVEVKGGIVKFGPWQGYSVHIPFPQDSTSPPSPGVNTVFSEDWQDTTLDGLVIQRFLGARTLIAGGYLWVWGDNNSYIVITIPSNVVCLAMYGVDITEEFVPVLGKTGMIILTSLLIMLSVFVLYNRRQRAANRLH